MRTLKDIIVGSNGRGCDIEDTIDLFARIAGKAKPSVAACILRPENISIGENPESTTWKLSPLPVNPDEYVPDTSAEPEDAFIRSLGLTLNYALNGTSPMSTIPSRLDPVLVDLIIGTTSIHPSERPDLPTVRNTLNNLAGIKKIPWWKNSYVIILFVVILSALIGLGGYALSHHSSGDTPQSAAQSGSSNEDYKQIESNILPDVSGLSFDEARAKLEPFGKTVTAQYSVTPDYNAGTVFSQNPPAGTDMSLWAGNEIVLKVSSGKKDAEIPNVVGMSSDTARDILQSLGIDVTVRDVDSQNPSGQVVSQDPTAGQTGKSVTIVVSTGKMPVPSANVGSDVNITKSELERLGFKVQTATTDTPDEALDGKVMSVSSAGMRIDYGSTVTINVGRYVKPTPTPTPSQATPTPTPTTTSTPDPTATPTVTPTPDDDDNN